MASRLLDAVRSVVLRWCVDSQFITLYMYMTSDCSKGVANVVREISKLLSYRNCALCV